MELHESSHQHIGFRHQLAGEIGLIDVITKGYARWFVRPQAVAGGALRQDIELLRVVSAFAIVWFHCGVPGSYTAHSGLMVFAILSVFFASKTKSVAERARRLLVPWLIWDLFYAGLNIARGHPAFPFYRGPVAVVLGGSMFHLWYLPFIFIVLISLDQLRARLGVAMLAWSGAALSAVCLYFAPALWQWGGAWGPPFAEYSCVLQYIFFGVFISGYHALPVWPRTIVLWALFLAAITEPLLHLDLPSAMMPLSAALTTWLLLFRRPKTWSIDIRPLSQCALGVYLLHPLFLMLALKWHMPQTVALPIMVFAVTLAAVMLARRYAPDFARHAL